MVAAQQWGSFSAAGRRRLVKVEGKNNAAEYKEFLKDNLTWEKILPAWLDVKMAVHT